MLTRRIRLQLAVFAVLTVFGVGTVLVNYLDLRQLLGFGQYEVTAVFPDATGLHPGAMVGYRDVEIGKVRSVDLGDGTAVATLGIDDDVRVPARLHAAIRSKSAIGEQSVNLTPTANGPPWLQPGDQITATTTLPRTDVLITSLNDLAASVPQDELTVVLDELTTGLGGKEPQVTALLENTRTVLHQAGLNLEPTVDLIRELGPFLRTQQQVAPETRSSLRDLAVFTEQLRRSDADLRGVFAHTPPAADELIGLQDRLTPALPQLLADLEATGQVVRTQLPGVSQTLVLYPAVTAALQRVVQQPGAAPASAHLGIRVSVNSTPPCYTGYTPMSQQRSFDDGTPAETPRDQYCKVAPDDPRSVRGARNYPCANDPTRRGPTAASCGARPEEVVAPYDPSTGGALLPDGHLVLLGDVRQQPRGEERTWRDLLLK
ncbi:MCE family protein [Saccharopolyspora rhizosphaerae]|uniref:MCE family protein n=1 Tax=Saccharopolyspora rhizosphaerae TaxID=2492662 RepID=A0A3R8P281_9PSEU|nr:MlaD family protein [Saccharopolyspora rhizosphaerae]RRO17967.1 MCE family protein [Saccharopolyspora rhizosphaerae]